MRRRSFSVLAGVGVLASVLASCSSAPDTPAASGGTQAAAGGGGKTGKIVVIVPLTGPDGGLGLGVRNSVQLAVRQAQARGDLPGWKLDVETIDDTGEADKAKAAAVKAAGDDQVVAVIGSIYSGLTKAALPPLAAKGIPVVSPSATNPTLTKGDAYDTAPKRTFPTFFRVIAPDDAHGPAVANFLAGQGIHRVVTADDGDTYGTGLVKAFTAAYTHGKGNVVAGHATVPLDGDGTYPDIVKQFVAEKPQAIFYGGNDAEGAGLSRQAKRAGLAVPLAGGDALGTSTYVPLSGAVSAGDISTAAGRPVADTEAGRAYLAAYRAGGFGEPATVYGPLGYNAAEAVLSALKTSLPSAADPRASRPATVSALAKVSFDGTNGKVAFDAYGDITPRVVTVGVLRAGAWKPAQAYSF